jgi:hypothetical protein
MSMLYLLSVATPFGVSRRRDTVPCPHLDATPRYPTVIRTVRRYLLFIF